MQTISQLVDATWGEGAAGRVLSPGETPDEARMRLESESARLQNEMRGLALAHATRSERRAHASRPRELTPEQRGITYDACLLDTSHLTDAEMRRRWERRPLPTDAHPRRLHPATAARAQAIYRALRPSRDRRLTVRITPRESRPAGASATGTRRDVDDGGGADDGPLPASDEPPHTGASERGGAS